MNLIKLAWRNILRNKRRTLASLLTVALGASGLLVYQGFKDGIMNQYRENTIRVRYGHGQIFTKDYYNKVYEKPWQHWITDWQTLEAKILAQPGVVTVFPRVGFSSLVQKGEISLAGRGEGTLGEREEKFFTAMNFESGGDIQSESDIILGKGLADSLGAKVGDTITILTQTVNSQLNGSDFIVSGVFHTGAKEFDDRFFRISLNVAQSLLDTQAVEYISVQTQGVEYWSNFAKSFSTQFEAYNAIPFEELDKVYYKNSVDFLEAQFQFIRTIILFIVALGIFNTIAIGLLERSGEVGALLANGESRLRLYKIFFIENAFLGLIGGAAGALLAIIIDKTLLSGGIEMPPGPGITRQFTIFLEIAPHHIVQATFLPAIATLVASVLPIRRLLTRPITELLRANN